jgi:mono/diheme cytochrome c family protein
MMILLIIGMVSGFYFLRLSDPYLQAVLSIQGNQTRGKAIFHVNCAACHGNNGNGNLGPSLEDISKHKSKISLINQVISGKTPPMPKFQPSSQDMADLLSYLQQL